jgi:hypothetical protein
MHVIYRLCDIKSTNPSPLFQDDKVSLNKYCLNSFLKGMSDIDRAALEEMLRSSRAETTAATKSIIENRAARGMAGGGDELAAALGASQSSANRRSGEALKLAAQAAANRQNALATSSNMAQSIEAQDYNRAAALANKRDAIAEFNNRLSNDTSSANVANRNKAALVNLENAQKIQDANVDLRNKQQQYNRGLEQQRFDNQMRKTESATGQARNLSNLYGNRAAGTADMYASTAAGIGGLIKAFSDGSSSKITPDANNRVQLDRDEIDNQLTVANRNRNLTSGF